LAKCGREESIMTLLALQGVTKGYGEGASRTPVLHDINLEIGEGEFVAVVGFSGSGKTTLISAIAGLIEPDAGTITKPLQRSWRSPSVESRCRR